MSMSSKESSTFESQPVFLDVHKGRPCTACILCKETAIKYTHP